MNQLEVQYQDILHILDKLLANLGLMLEDYDVEYLTQADLYIEIFKIMFPVLEPVLNADFGEDITDEELIQYLIDVLAKDIIKMDLGHIRGELIAQGDAKNILNFLQLLFEISNMVVDKDDGDKDKQSKKNKNKKLVRSSGNSADQTSNHSEQSSLELNQKYNSVQGINAEFSNSSVVESNRDASEAGAEEAAAYYEEVQANRVQNKMVFDQHQQMKGMKGGDSRGNSRSVSRISEVSKSKESSEYDRGMKKLSQNEFNPAVLQVKGLVASENGGKRGSYTSDDIRELKGENGEEEEDELEEEEEEEEEGTENEYEEHQQQDMGGARQFTNEEEDDGVNEQYYPETNGEDEIEEDDDGFSDHMIKKISKEEVGDDLEYYPSDPINYNAFGKNQANHQQRNSQSAEKEGSRARAIQSVDVRHDDMEEPEEEYEQEEEQEEEEEEQDELVEEEEQDSQQREYYENEEEYGEATPETDPRMAEYREEMEEVAEEEYEDDENAEPNQRMYQVQAGKKAVKAKGKGKAKKTGTKKAAAQPKAVVDYKKPKVEYRPLRPATAGMKRPQTAKPGKTAKVNKSQPVRSSGRKSNESTSSRSKKMMHSKSEKHLHAAEEEEQSQTGDQDYSEDKGMEPKEYQPGDSQVPSQHGHAGEYSGIEEEQEYDEQDYENQQAQQQIPDGNVFKILSENVMRVKENLRENRAIEDVPYDDEKTVKMIRQQKEQYKQYLKDFVKDHEMREKKYEQMRELGTKNFQKKMKSESIRDVNMRRDFENQQKSLYYKMRDEKVNYLRRIHKTIFELEKKRIIDEKKEYMEFRKTKNVEAVNMIESIKNQYRHKLSILRENNANQQYERKIASEAQRTFIKTLENELKMDQMKEVERLKDKWRLEKERFDMMIKDEGFLEQKVMQLYKKGVF